MTVTEIATLTLLSPHTWDTPAIREFFVAVSEGQGNWSGHPVRLFQDITDSQTIYLIGGWESVPAHLVWIASKPNQRLLERAEGLIKVVGLEHAQLDCAIADAPYLSWTRRVLSGGEVVNAGDGVGVVVEEKEEAIWILKGYETESDDVAAVEGNAEKRRMRRLAL